MHKMDANDLEDIGDLKEGNDIGHITPRKKYIKLKSWKLYRKALKCTDYEEKQQRAAFLKEEADCRDLQRKFMFLHRFDINKWHNEIIEKKVRDFNQHKKRMKAWVGVIKLLEFARFTMAQFYVCLSLNNRAPEKDIS